MSLAQWLTSLGFHHLGFIMLPLTHLGNLFLLGGLSLLLGLWLAAASGFRAVLLWATMFGGCVLSLAALKIYFAACPIEHWYLRSPSGHSAMSALVYGAISCCTLRAAPYGLRILIIVGTVSLIGGIAVSRVLLEMHSGPEVLMGLGLGIVFLLLFGTLYLKLPQHALGWKKPLLALALLFLILKFVIRPVSLEAFFHGISVHWQVSAQLCGSEKARLLSPPGTVEQEI